MMYILYDFENTKRRTKFSKFLEQFGERVQYSVFLIKNSRRHLQKILKEIELKYAPNFGGCDSVIIIPVCEGCKKKMQKYGSSAHDDIPGIVFFG